MKKLKQKFKRALAGFLRDELLEYIGYNHKIPFMSLNDRFNIDNIPFETMVMEIQIPVSYTSMGGRDSEYILENEIKRAKENFASQIMDHIHVDAQNLVSHEYFMRRSVKFVLRVQGKK